MKVPINPEEIKDKVYSEKTKESVTGFWKEFQDFAIKGDVIDLAVGIIIGGAFNTVIQSLVNDIIMPIFGRILGDAAFSELFINLSDTHFDTLAEAVAAGAPVIKYGLFLTNVLNFLIVAFTIFLVLKFFFRRKKEVEKQEK